MTTIAKRILRPFRNALRSIAGPFWNPLKRALTNSMMAEMARRLEDVGNPHDQGRIISTLRFLIYDSSTTRRLLRYAIAENPIFQELIAQTYKSFDYQWGSLPDGSHMLSNPDFQRVVADLICAYTGLDRAWFKGKKVLDAGCGNGRFSWGLASMGASVTSLDISDNGIANLRRIAGNSGLDVTCIKQNLLEPINLRPDFDLVWSFGVLHHTGNTYKGFRNVQALVPKGGLFFLMLYGEPRLDHQEDFWEVANYDWIRHATINKPFAEKVQILSENKSYPDVHGLFDAVSPFVNDIYSFAEIESWLLHAGFGDIRRTQDHKNHFVMSRRMVAAQASPAPHALARAG